MVSGWEGEDFDPPSYYDLLKLCFSRLQTYPETLSTYALQGMAVACTPLPLFRYPDPLSSTRRR